MIQSWEGFGTPELTGQMEGQSRRSVMLYIHLSRIDGESQTMSDDNFS